MAKTTTEKSKRFRLAKQELCTCITLFAHFFSVLADHNMKVPNFTFCGGHEHKTIFVVVFFYNLDTVFWNSTPENVTNITKLNDTE